MKSPSQYFSENREQIGNVTVYYPGSGADLGPMKLFAENCNLSLMIHIDYGLDKKSAEAPLQAFAAQSLDLWPQDHFLNSWDAFWPNDEESRAFRRPEDAYGFRLVLGRPRTYSERNSNMFLFMFLRTEAVKTFDVFFRSKPAPTVIVLQDHGYGENWTTFGRGGKLESRARALKKLPKYLFVADNTEPWDGYEQISEYVVYEGQMHNFGRALYRRDRTS